MIRAIISTVIQLALGIVIVFAGWDILYNIIRPTSNNWGWIMELMWSFTTLSFLIVVSNLVSKENARLRNLFLSIQLVVLLAYVASRYTIFRHRSMFMLFTYTIFILSIIPIAAFIGRAGLRRR